MELMQMIRDKRILLVAHRGVCGANIPCNSMAAFRAAVHHGADIVELDVERSLDGELFIQHPGMESVHLRMKDSIKNYPASVVENFVLSNSESARTEHKIARLEEALTYLRGKCIVNIDKFWENPEKIAALVRKLGMENDVIIKTANKPGYGYDALKGEYVDMIERGIIDPTKVTRSALQNAASVAAMVLTTESLVADIPAPEPAPAAPAGGMGGMY